MALRADFLLAFEQRSEKWIKTLTFQFHPHLDALFKSASWTLFTCWNGNRTQPSTKTNIVLFVLNCQMHNYCLEDEHGISKLNYLNSSLEEAFTTFAREDSIMESRYFVATNRTGAEKLGYRYLELKTKVRNLHLLISCCLEIPG